ncbi:MAG: sulfite exporter TauE/SafE family protein [Bacteroidia bacterium]|nr:sulfite exporter TauE/SafE family protein [Bacteroidia bacterium]
MTEWINTALNSGAGSFSMLFAVFLLGIISTFTSCCNYAIIGSVTGYSASYSINSSKKSQILFSIAFLLGSVISLAIIGAIMGYIGSAVVEAVGAFWKIAVAILLILFGLLSLGLVPIKIPQLNIKSTKKGFLPGLVLGIFTGGLSLVCNVCCNPILPIVLGASFVKASILWGTLILIAYAIGYSLPFTIAIAGIQMGFGKISNKMKNASKIITYIAGVIMILSGFYLIYTF